MKYRFISTLLLAANAFFVNAKVTFKVIAISDTPSVVVNNKKYVMELEQYPVYSVTLNHVNSPVKYHYVLGSEEESFTRSIESGIETTLNEFFNRSVTVKKHPLLPQVFPMFPTLKKSKLFDDTTIGTLLIEGNDNDIKKLHNNSGSDTKYNVKITYVSPYNIKIFQNGKINISGQSSKWYKKLNYKISDLKTDDDKELFGRTALKLRGEYNDPSFMREKTYFDMLNAIGVPTSQSKHVRVFINKQPIGLYLITDDFSNKHFLKSMFNNGKKFTIDNAVFKVNSGGNLSYINSKDNLKPYSYKGSSEKAIQTEMLNNVLIPFMKDVDEYPITKQLNFDIESFLKSMALEFLAYGNDNYWMVQGNYFIFKDTVKDMWYFIDSDFDVTFGHGSPDKCLNTTLDNYVLIKNKGSSRPLIDNIRSVPSNNAYLEEAVKTIIKNLFNINIAGPRIDSFAELIKEDALWDFGLERMNTSTERELKEKIYTESDFEREIASSTNSKKPYPIKSWILQRSKSVASQYNMSIPLNVPSTNGINYFEPEYESIKIKNDDPKSIDITTVTTKETTSTSNKTTTIKKITTTTKETTSTSNKTTITKRTTTTKKITKTTTTAKKITTNIKTTTKKSLPTNSKRQCGDSVAICASGYCCSKYGWCGRTKDYCGSGCQKSFGKCW